jgi:hypothetical protein
VSRPCCMADNASSQPQGLSVAPYSAWISASSLSVAGNIYIGPLRSERGQNLKPILLPEG